MKRGQTTKRAFTTVESNRLNAIMIAPKGSQHNMKKRFMKMYGRTKEEVSEYIRQKSAENNKPPIMDLSGTMGDPSISLRPRKQIKGEPLPEDDTFEIRFKLKQVRIQGDELVITAQKNY